nr:hypothetical protein [Tanacetum cinerariifolium]
MVYTIKGFKVIATNFFALSFRDPILNTFFVVSRSIMLSDRSSVLLFCAEIHKTPYFATTHFGVVTIHLEPYVPQREGNVITTDDQAEDQRKLVKASSIVRPDLDEPVTVEFMINGKTVYVTEQEIQAYRHKEEEIKKAEEEARLNAISKPKVRKSLELIKHMYDSYIWTVSSKLKRKPITAIKIHPKTKPVVITVYRGTDARNFNVHKPFLFGAFGISELDELREIISKKKNTVVKDLMNSLSRRYERLRKIHVELGIQSALPALEQALPQTSGRKWKHMELMPETRIP